MGCPPGYTGDRRNTQITSTKKSGNKGCTSGRGAQGANPHDYWEMRVRQSTTPSLLPVMVSVFPCFRGCWSACDGPARGGCLAGSVLGLSRLRSAHRRPVTLLSWRSSRSASSSSRPWLRLCRPPHPCSSPLHLFAFGLSFILALRPRFLRRPGPHPFRRRHSLFPSSITIFWCALATLTRTLYPRPLSALFGQASSPVLSSPPSCGRHADGALPPCAYSPAKSSPPYFLVSSSRPLVASSAPHAPRPLRISGAAIPAVPYVSLPPVFLWCLARSHPRFGSVCPTRPIRPLGHCQVKPFRRRWRCESGE